MPLIARSVLMGDESGAYILPVGRPLPEDIV